MNQDEIKRHKLNAEEDYTTTPISVLAYISLLESKLNELSKPDLSLYKIDFLNWLEKYFTKSIKVLRYKSKTSNKMYTLQELEQKFNKAYQENPYIKH